MLRTSYRTMLMLGTKHVPRRCCVFNPCESVTDPTLAMSGTELAVASMLGQPIPQPRVNYSFNSATTPEQVSPIDSLRADPFEIFSEQQRQHGEIKTAYDVIKSSPEYQQYLQGEEK